MKVYQTNSGLGYNQLAYLIKINETSNEHNYLTIGERNLPIDCSYKVGELAADLEEIDIEESNYRLEQSPLFGGFLFKHFIKTTEMG